MKSLLMVAILSLMANLSFAADKTQAAQIIEVQVTENGFEPNQIEVKADTPVVLKVTRKTDNTCATEVKMKEKKVNKALPLNETVSVDLGKLKKGEHKYSCGMDMLSGLITAK